MTDRRNLSYMTLYKISRIIIIESQSQNYTIYTIYKTTQSTNYTIYTIYKTTQSTQFYINLYSVSVQKKYLKKITCGRFTDLQRKKQLEII